MDREELIDEFIAADTKTDLGMWESCVIAWELFDKYGEYSQETVSVLSKACNLGYDAIYNRRNAWEELVTLFPVHRDGGKDKIRSGQIPHPLKPSHFYRLHRLRNNSIFITDDEARAYITTALEFCWSSGQLCDTVAGNHDSDPEKTFVRKATKLVRKIQNLFSDSERMGRLGFPDPLMKQVYQTQKAIEEWLITKGESNERTST